MYWLGASVEKPIIVEVTSPSCKAVLPVKGENLVMVEFLKFLTKLPEPLRRTI